MSQLPQVHLYDETSPGIDELFSRFCKDILELAFPPEQYTRGLYEEVPDRVLIACGPDGALVGGAIGELYPRSSTLLLGYLAVREELRGGGFGGLLMQAIADRWVSTDLLLVLEVDDPRHHPTHPSYGDPAKRVRFYSRFGVQAIAAPYFQPRLSPDLPRSYHLMLSTLAVPGAMRRGGGIDGNAVEAFLREYFEDCEGAPNPDDDQLRWLLEAYRRPALALVPIDDFEAVPDPTPPTLAPPS